MMSSAAMPTFAALPSDPDVVIVGAGAAGIGAAHRLIAEGKSVAVVEAADRIGGRAKTDTETFGFPYDQGCAWMQGPDDLPWLKIAQDNGFSLRDASNLSGQFRIDGATAPSAERQKYYRTWEKFYAALDDADDVSAASVVPQDAPYAGVVQSWMGPMDHGVDLTDLSTGDYNSYTEDYAVNYLVKEGLGTLVAMHGAGLPVALNTAVTAIDWTGGGVKVETTGGTIRAKAVIITVSVGVLASGAIRFTPDLPVAKQEAVADVPMGLLVRIPLHFGGERFGLSKNSFLTYAVPNEMPADACYFLNFPHGQDITIGFVGGSLGWDLSRAGEDAAIDFALGEFAAQMGSDAKQHFTKGHMSDWALNPLTQGAYSAAKPGRHAARNTLAEPVADRLFFAGEAVAAPYIALCGGAHLSGEKVAADVIEVLDREGCSSCDTRGRQRAKLLEQTE
ncbi:MAG: NAD(P)/FAD-dependent oxidoreductase [Pseudomonadota bacterium]